MRGVIGFRPNAPDRNRLEEIQEVFLADDDPSSCVVPGEPPRVDPLAERGKRDLLAERGTDLPQIDVGMFHIWHLPAIVNSDERVLKRGYIEGEF